MQCVLDYVNSCFLFQSFCLSILVYVSAGVGISIIDFADMEGSRKENWDDIDGACFVYIWDVVD